MKTGSQEHQSAKRVVVIGSVNYDLTSYVNEFPKPNETISSISSAANLGGKGLNQAVAAARMGANVHMIGCIGGGQFGDAAKIHLQSNGVNIDYLVTNPEAMTGTAAIAVDHEGNNTIIVNAGANQHLSKKDIDHAKKIILTADVVLVQAELSFEAIEYALRTANEAQIPTIFNPAPANPALVNLLKYVDYVTPNETETETLTGVNPSEREDILTAITVLNQTGVGNVVITCGSRGCIVGGSEGFSVSLPYNVTAIDTTGAGDVFNGVFAYGIAHKMNIADAVDIASAAAALSVEKKTANSAPHYPEVEALMSSKQEEK